MSAIQTHSLVSAWEHFLTDHYKIQLYEAALNAESGDATLVISFAKVLRRDPILAQYLTDHVLASLGSAEEAAQLLETPDPRPHYRIIVRGLPEVET